jgi:hypothetical protein
VAEPADPAGSTPERCRLFEVARRHAECPVNQLWAQYLGLGGTLDLVSIDAFLNGLAPLPPTQQDVLANALNEQLDEHCQKAKVPYLQVVKAQTTAGNPLTVLDELLGREQHGDADEE